MASVRFEKGSKEWLMFQDYWKLCQEFWGIEENDEYWDTAVRETSEFYKKYKDVVLSKYLAIAFSDSLAERNKKRGESL